MKWELKHFGLELYTSESLKRISKVEIHKAATFDEKKGREIVHYGLLDPRLEGPKNIETFSNCIGHIKLQTPLIRTECSNDILEILQEWAEETGCLEQGITGKEAVILEAPSIFKILVDVKTKEERYLKMATEEVLDVLKAYGLREIKGNEFIKHNKIALPETMIVWYIPVPSILARPSRLDSDGNYVENDLTLKLFDILRINKRIKENMDRGAPQIVIEDLSELLQYHFTTYLDNRTLGIPPARGVEGKPVETIAQRLGKNMKEHIQYDILETKVDSSIKRIVRCINSGERVIQVVGGSMDELAVELTKQCALKKVFSNLIWDDPVTCHQINSAGECKKMVIDVLENDEFIQWDNYSAIEKSTIIHAYKDSKITDFGIPSILPTFLRHEKFYLLDDKEKVVFEICKTVYSIIEKQTMERNYPSIIIIPDEIVNHSALEKAFHLLESNELYRLEVVLILWRGQRRMAWKEETGIWSRGIFTYHPTDNSKRYSLIAINHIKKMKEFENHLEEIKRWEKSDEYERDLVNISTIVKFLIYPEIKRLIGQVLQAEGKLKIDILREYTISVLNDKISTTEHGEWQFELKKQLEELRAQSYENKVPISEIHEKRTMRAKFAREARKQPEKRKKDAVNQDEVKKQLKQNKKKANLTYDDIKGLEPLVTWCKRTGRLFSDEAKEFGFDGYPKGLLLTGVPGCGKTMTAKVISNEWGMGFKRYQADDFVSSNVGGAEEKTRNILNELDAFAPIICFVDEAEKIFGQTKATDFYRTPDASRDSVESMILQFMEENEKGVFFIFTANDYEKLSPALVDRFDERFFIDLPTEESRKEIIKSTLINNKQDFSKYNLDKLAKTSNNFTGRDIRSAINEGMMIAFDNNRKLSGDDLISAFQVTSPTSKIHKENIEKMRKLVSEGKMRKANTYEPGELINFDDESFRGFE